MTCPLCATDHDGWRTTGCAPRTFTPTPAGIAAGLLPGTYSIHPDGTVEHVASPSDGEQVTAAIVAWLRAEADEGGARRAALHYAADAIERGEHLGRKP